MRRAFAGSLVGLLSLAVLAAALVPLRGNVSIATIGLILVVPVVTGVAVGGYPAGVVTVTAGFLVYDYVFIPPYYTLSVGAGQNWVALAVYAVVMLVVAQVVGRFQEARAEAQRRAQHDRLLFELSEQLITDRSLVELLQSVVNSVQSVFGVAGVALLLPEGGRLATAATAGEPLTAEELSGLEPESGRPVALGTVASGRARSGGAAPGGAVSGRAVFGRYGEGPGQVRAVALSAAGRPVGILALRTLAPGVREPELLQTFANHAALAIDRAQLQAQAMRSELLEEADRLRRALLGAVSHDLRTPLATMKVATTTLMAPGAELTDANRAELYDLIDTQTDRLTRLVTGLLDMTRFQAGTLKVRPSSVNARELVADVLAGLSPSLADRQVQVDVADDLPPVEADAVLISQVIANLVDNADRHAPPSTPITVSASAVDGKAQVSVADRGPGVPAGEHQAVFESFVRFDTGGRAGLGLWISKAFVEAHGQRIWVEDVSPSGARFVFTLPLAPLPAAVGPGAGAVAGAVVGSGAAGQSPAGGGEPA